MNSIINRDTTNNWPFLRNDLLSIFAADDARLLEEHNDEQMDKLFDELAVDYLDDWTVSGFCIDAEDNINDVLNMIVALSAYHFHPFRWDIGIEYDKDNHFSMISCPYRINLSLHPHVIMIDVSNSGDNYTKEFVEILDEYMTLWGYGRMDLVYEKRLVYINKLEYSLKTKDTANIRDSVNNDLYVVRFDPYTFKHLPNMNSINKAIVTLFKTEADISCNTADSEEFDILFTGEKSVDEEIRYTVSKMCNSISVLPCTLPTNAWKYRSSSIETTETENGLRVSITTAIKDNSYGLHQSHPVNE